MLQGLLIFYEAGLLVTISFNFRWPGNALMPFSRERDSFPFSTSPLPAAPFRLSFGEKQGTQGHSEALVCEPLPSCCPSASHLSLIL